MSSIIFSFDNNQFNRLFPFFILIDENLKIAELGNSLHKFHLGLKTKPFTSQFKVKNTDFSISDFKTLLSLTDQPLIIESINNPKINLKGQFEFLETTNQILFVGSPVFGSFDEAEELNLKATDFAFHDPYKDLLQNLKMQRIVNEDVKKLLKTLNYQRDELKRLSLISQETINGVVITDAKERIQWVNKAFERISGYSLEEVVGKVPGNFLQGKDTNPETVNYIRQRIANAQSFECEIVNYTKLGKAYWIKISGQPLFDKDGKLSQFFALEEDITDRKKNEELLKKAEERWQFALEGAGDGVWEFNFLTGEIYFSTGYKKMLGYTDTNFKNDVFEWLNKIHPDDLEEIKATDKLYEKGKISHHKREYRIKNIEGKYIWVLDRGMVISRTDEGKPLRIIGIHTNITERKEIEEKLFLNEKRYRDLFNYSQALICTHDLTGTILTVNPALCEVLGYHSNEMVGKKLQAFIPPKDVERFKPDYLDKIIAEEKVNGLFRVVQKNGNKLFLLYQNYKVKEEGLEPYVIGFSQDITDRVKAENELLLAKKMTEEAARAKEIFLANMSHEIRTPMSGILGVAGLLAKTNLDRQQKNYINLITESANNLLVIVNEVLDIEKIASGKLDFENVHFRISEKTATTLQSFQYKAEEKGLNLHFKNDLPHDLIIQGDPYRLSQILNNLLSNAIKFTQEGKIIVTASLQKHNNEKVIIDFMVKDTGIGIPDNRLSVIFDPFVQASSDTTRKYGGTGLGLSICKNLVELQGGKISVSSKENEGTAFNFSIPYSKGSADLLAEDTKIEVNFNAIGKKKILVAEDVELNQFLARHILEGWGFLVDIANNGNEAVDLASQKNYDLILMDIQMPEMDGITATEKIRKLNADISAIPIIALTANALKGDNQRYLNAGMNDYITKPYTEERLFKVISKFLKPSEKNDSNKKEIMPEEIIKNDAEENKKLYDLSMVNLIGKDNPAFVKTMIKLFLDTIPAELQKLEEAAINNEHDKISFIAHKMKSTIDSMGITTIAATIRKLELKGEIKETHESIVAMTNEVKNILGKVINQMRSDFSDL